LRKGELDMTCPHPIWEQETAIGADALCPLCLKSLLAAAVREREDWNGKHQEATLEIERLRATVEAAAMAKTRLDHFADYANAGKVHYDARELKRKIWGAFAEFDACQQTETKP
jgi:hypothetical protein